MEIIVKRHCVAADPATGLSPLQTALVEHTASVRIANAPTGAGKSYAFQWAMANRGERILFMVPTRRLAQNLVRGLMEDLASVTGWSRKAAEAKVVLWSSDATELLKRQGFFRIGPYRVRQITSLDSTREGGEMIVAIPETLSHLLLQRSLVSGQSDVGVFDAMASFDHIVFDEFHTIEPRGFGLAALFAKLAADGFGRAKVSFLSATPLDIRPVLEKLDIEKASIADLSETVSEQGRAVHGDVKLCFEEKAAMVEMIADHISEVKEQIKAGRQIVVIYNKLEDLKRQKDELRHLLLSNGIRPERALAVNSIDDSADFSTLSGEFAEGRNQNPDDFDILIATASIEMGVTFRAELMFMEPGFSQLNFLQRYGRAARGDRAGWVIVREDAALADKNPWLRSLLQWAGKKHGASVGITDLTEILTKDVRRNFKNVSENHPAYFGSFPARAAYASGLYWLALMNHSSNSGHKRQQLREHMPQPAKVIRALLYSVRRMADDPFFARSAKEWCDRFEKQAFTLRDIGRKIRVLEGDGRAKWVSERWLVRVTEIADSIPLQLGEDGEEEFRINGRIEDYFRDKSKHIKDMRAVYFPHKSAADPLPASAELPKLWKRELRHARDPQAITAWDEHRESMEAAEKLVLFTGLVVGDEEAVSMDSCSAVW